MNRIKKLYILLLAGIVIFAGCNKTSLTDLNKDPQAVEDIDPNFLFSTALLSLAGGGTLGIPPDIDNRTLDWRTNIAFCSYLVQHLSHLTGGPGNGDKYFEYVEADNTPFRYFYTDGLRRMADILYRINNGKIPSGLDYNNLKQATRILRAFSFQRLTDLYGSIPYSEALNPWEGVFRSKYDKQRDIYLALLKELDEASASFVPNTTDGFAAIDMYYDGDIEKWKRFGYSLMLRMAMRVSNVDLETANTYVAKAVAGGVFKSNEDNVIVPMTMGPIERLNQNGMSKVFIPDDGTQSSDLSKTMIDFLKGDNPRDTADDDPRLMIISGGIALWQSENNWQPLNENPLDQKGMPNGSDDRSIRLAEGLGPNEDFNKNEIYSRVNRKFFNRDEPYMLMNYGEVELNLAEAAERGIGGLTSAVAKTHYDAGAKASIQMLVIYDPSFAVADARVASYLNTYPYTGGEAGLEMIGEQLWVNHFLNWYEAWSDYRRTGYPKLVPVNYPGNVTGGKIPTRIRYPQAELINNADNYRAGSTKPDNYTTKLWWAGGPE